MGNRLKCLSCGTLFKSPTGNVRSVFPCPGCGKSVRKMASRSKARAEPVDPFTAFMTEKAREPQREKFSSRDNEQKFDEDELEDDGLDGDDRDNRDEDDDILDEIVGPPHRRRKGPLTVTQTFELGMNILILAGMTLPIILLGGGLFVVAMFHTPEGPEKEIGWVVKILAWAVFFVVVGVLASRKK